MGKNDNFYFTSPSIEGPWVKRGLFCPKGALTYNSQTTYVFMLKDDEDVIPMFMGDRWSYPLQASAATYVWMPLQIEGEKVSIPEYWQCWDASAVAPVDLLAKAKSVDIDSLPISILWHKHDGLISSNTQGGSLVIPFVGTRAAITGESNSHGGYARVSVLDKEGDKRYQGLVDFYSLNSERAIRLITPELPYGEYQLQIEVTGISPIWDDKNGHEFGSDNTYVNIEKIYSFAD